MTPLKSELAAFIEKNLIGSERKITVDDQTPLIEEGIIDSMGLMQIVSFLEERAGVRVPDEEVGPDNFETLEAIDQMVKRLQDAPGTSLRGGGPIHPLAVATELTHGARPAPRRRAAAESPRVRRRTAADANGAKVVRRCLASDSHVLGRHGRRRARFSMSLAQVWPQAPSGRCHSAD